MENLKNYKLLELYDLKEKIAAKLHLQGGEYEYEMDILLNDIDDEIRSRYIDKV